ncbi:MAG: cytidine deaminase [Pseudopedobacter saltans]|uniref:Cytidine deaminase n=1 Tax=Pseudopedobacter saltans TaxID=151895 RepID=A0A2W5ELM0_9SPHI|nr:MAG: cytidine deaminase [Pseudopedobacter saltans]
MQKELLLQYQEYNNKEELNDPKKALLDQAIFATKLAYAPYSKFRVGAAVLMEDGRMISGANIENASFPAGICAERAALSSVSSLAPNVKILSIAVSYINDNGQNESIISPCGICRQVISEYQQRQGSPISILLSNSLPSSKVIEIPSIEALLPFMFTKASLD